MLDDAKGLDPRYFPLILDVLDQGVFTVDGNTCISSFNQMAERITGYAADEVIGVRCAEVFRTDLCDQVCPLRLSIASRRPTRNREIHIKAKDGHAIPISVSTAPLLTRGGKLLGGVEVFRDLTQIQDLKRRADAQYRLSDIIGKSAAMRRIFDLLPLVAPSDSTVLVTGETGSGKEVVAKLIHARSGRRFRPFVVVECAALQESLLQSELFGHERGAFTGAERGKPGLFEVAHGGTIFLDEIGEVPHSTQVQLLRVLDTSTFRHVGGTEEIHVDVRVIAATNRDLPRMIAQGLFREDLYYRLSTISIDVPPLRERRADVRLLAAHFLSVLNERYGARRRFSPEAMDLMCRYDWPGNVRELLHVVEAATVVSEGPEIRPEHLRLTGSVDHEVKDAPTDAAAPLTLAELERQHIERVLKSTEGHRGRAAQMLGVSERNLYRKLREYGLLR